MMISITKHVLHSGNMNSKTNIKMW